MPAAARLLVSVLAWSAASVLHAAPATEGVPEESGAAMPLSQGHLRTGAVSFDVAFPGGGAFTGTNAIGARFFLSPTFATGVFGQFSYDKGNALTAYGATLRMQSFVRARTRANLYAFAQASAGQTKRNNKTEASLSETQAGAAAGLGIEIFLLPELSTSVDIGLGGTFLPSDKATATTGTSQLALHYFIGEE